MMRDYGGFLPNNSTGFQSASGRRFRRQTGEPVSGCTDPEALNFDTNAEVDDGSCEYNMGCTNIFAYNYDTSAQFDDGSCQFEEAGYGIFQDTQVDGASSSDGNYIGGCLNTMGQNFNPNANYDDGSCIFVGGCTDPLAVNYDNSAQFDDGSCVILQDESGYNPPSAGTNVGDLLDELADAAGGPTGGASGGSSGGMVTDSEGFFEKDPKSRQRKKPQNRFSGFAGRDECGFVASGLEGDVFTEGAPPSQPYIASVASV